MSVICIEHARLSCESHAHALLSAARFHSRWFKGAELLGQTMPVAASTLG